MVHSTPGLSLSRRTLLRGAALGAGAFAVPAALAACSKSDSDDSSSGSQQVTFGSNYSDAVPKAAIAEVMKASGQDVKVNTVDHNTFQENLTRYLQTTPDDVFTWFAGYRMQYFAAQRLTHDISDVWSEVGANYSEAFKAASTGADGKQYFIPFYNYPWAVFYRKSLFEQKGYTVPKTWDEFVALAKKMKTDGLAPIAMGQKDGWPAMGTFDYINMRLNGYDFHINLMGGKESWTDPKVKQVFQTWQEIMPYYQPGANGRTWEEAAQTLVDKKTGMYLLGMFVGQQFTGDSASDLDYFPYPVINEANGQDAVEAPIDGFMLSKSPKNLDGAKKLLTYLASPDAQLKYLKSDPNNIATNSKTDTSTYSALQKKAVELISNAKHISQFMDRDTVPAFASTVMIPSLQGWFNNSKDIDGMLKKIQDQAKTIFT